MIKKDGRREPFDRVKILAGLRKACDKRPVPVEELERVVDRIERELEEAGEKEIPSSRVGDAVMAALRDIDDVAYVRFASVYWSFRDLAELQAELKQLRREARQAVKGAFSAAGRALHAPRARARGTGPGHDPAESGGRRGGRARRTHHRRGIPPARRAGPTPRSTR